MIPITTPTPPGLSDSEWELLSGAAANRHLSGQIPHLAVTFSSSAPGPTGAAFNTLSGIPGLISKGLAAWNRGSKGSLVLYTQAPLNPKTGRRLSAYLWMTEHALSLYGSELANHALLSRQADALQNAAAFGVFQHSNHNPTPSPLTTPAEVLVVLAQNVVPADPLLGAAPYLPPSIPQSAVSPPSKAQFDSLGFTQILTVTQNKQLDKLLPYAGSEGAALVSWLSKNNVGPNTLRLTPHPKLPNRFDQSPADWLSLVLARIGTPDAINYGTSAGVSWSTSSFLACSRVIGGLDDAAATALIKSWDLLVSSGANPKQPAPQTGSTLWHAIKDINHPKVVKWLQDHQVDPLLSNQAGQQPLAALLKLCGDDSAACLKHSLFSSGAGVPSFLATAFAGLSSVINQEAKEEARAGKLARSMALEWIQKGADPFQADASGLRPIDNLFPDQMLVETDIKREREANGLPSDREAVQKDMFSWRKPYAEEAFQFLGKRSCYTPETQKFLEAIEQKCGQTFLHDTPYVFEVQPAAKSKKTKSSKLP